MALHYLFLCRNLFGRVFKIDFFAGAVQTTSGNFSRGPADVSEDTVETLLTLSPSEPIAISHVDPVQREYFLRKNILKVVYPCVLFS